jgi:hypothetical protein
MENKENKVETSKILIEINRDSTGRFTAHVDQPEPEHKPGCIIIKTEKLIPASGVPSRKIISWEGVLYWDNLPAEYKEQGPHCYYEWAIMASSKERKRISFSLSSIKTLIWNDTISESEFQRTLSYMRECANRLHEINSKIRELKKTWVGEETFEI